MKRTATAQWKGSGKDGQGHLSTQSGVFAQQPYSFRTRFENEDGRAGTNPEELLGAAHAGCYAMALSFQLQAAGYTADSLDVTAAVHLNTQGEAPIIDTIHLTLTAEVPGISEEEFLQLAQSAKEGCPVSRVLNAEITLDASLSK